MIPAPSLSELQLKLLKIWCFFSAKGTRWTNASIKLLKRRGWGDDGDEGPLAKCHTYSIYTYYIILYYIILQLYCRNDRRAITMNSSKTRSLCFSQADSLRYAVVWAMPWKGLAETVIHPGYPWSMPNFVWNTRIDGLVYKAMQAFFNSPDLICCNKANYGKIRSHATCNIWHHSAAFYTCGWRAQSTTCSRYSIS